MAACRDEVESLWRKELERRSPSLFNGSLANMIGWSLDTSADEPSIHVRVHFIEYKAFLAKRINPRLPLPVRAVGVSGLCYRTVDEAHLVLVAQRGDDVTQYPGYWELVPSGTLDESCAEKVGTVDCVRKITEEFTEETGLPAESIQSCDSVALIRDTHEDNYDVCFSIRIEPDKSLDTVHRAVLSREYVEPAWLSVSEIDRKLHANNARTVPVSSGLMEAWKRSGLYFA
jgi:8-oxo-dGTP pyrophosphatase MutT (NUDIX family)